MKLNPKLNISFCAYTGKASQILAQTLAAYGAKMEKDTVSTIHSLIYAPIVDDKGHISGWQRRKNIKAGLIIVDEASMIDRQIWEDLMTSGIPVLAVGDHGQLPPINPGFNLMSRPDIKLETIHRQAVDNPIIKLSMMARIEGKIPVGVFDRKVRKLSRYDSATASEVEDFLQSRVENRLVLVGFNRSRLAINQQMRTYLGFDTPEPCSGDMVICLRNNRDKGIFNGMIGRVKRISYSKNDLPHWFDTEIMMGDNEFVYSGNILRYQFNQEKTLKNWPGVPPQQMMDLFDFGYALTVHKAQGSQAKRVLLFEERNQHMTDDDWRRWLYTGITRAEEELLVVGI